MGGVLGLDMAAVFALGHALGFDETEIAIFLPFIEAGLIAACSRRDD